MILPGNPLINWRFLLLLAIATGCCVNASEDTSLQVFTQCHYDQSYTIEFPSDRPENLTMYTLVYNNNIGLYTICGERQINERKQLLEPRCQDPLWSSYLTVIFQNLDDFGEKIVVHADERISPLFSRSFVCPNKIDYYDRKKKHFGGASSKEVSPHFRQRFTINYVDLESVISFSNEERDSGNFSEPVQMIITIEDNYKYRITSNFKSCKLDIHYMDRDVESIYILRNSSLTPEGSKIEFQSEYTPWTDSELAKYTVNFKAFTLFNHKPFTFSCEASWEEEPYTAEEIAMMNPEYWTEPPEEN